MDSLKRRAVKARRSFFRERPRNRSQIEPVCCCSVFLRGNYSYFRSWCLVDGLLDAAGYKARRIFLPTFSHVFVLWFLFQPVVDRNDG